MSKDGSLINVVDLLTVGDERGSLMTLNENAQFRFSYGKNLAIVRVKQLLRVKQIGAILDVAFEFYVGRSICDPNVSFTGDKFLCSKGCPEEFQVAHHVSRGLFIGRCSDFSRHYN